MLGQEFHLPFCFGKQPVLISIGIDNYDCKNCNAIEICGKQTQRNLNE